ncbi:MAG: hypothetical protein KJ592_02545 [Nanoarchaeota archaeon]|nr:hypothetical protein [Nanoarchaeota archaeon]
MSKFLSILILVVLCLSGVLAADVAYVLKDSGRASANVISGIESLGLSYELIDDSEISSTDFDDFRMIVVWDGALIDDEFLPIKNKKSLVANSYHLEDWGIADYAGSQISSGKISVKVLQDSMITDGFQLLSSFEVYNQANVKLFNLPYPINRASGVKNIVSTDNYHEYPVVGSIDAGGKLYGGGVAGERIAFFGITESEYWSVKSKKLFANTVQWVMSGSDGDGDGYLYDDDCDDGDADVWENVLGYVDGDGDEFGSGDLVEVCSGNFLSEGYSAFSGDCDDSNFLTNPYSDDIYNNCVNDAPVVDEVLKVIVNESGDVVVEINAVDAEDDVLSYSTDDIRFSQDGNVFTWETLNDDAGIYFFSFNVSDGEFEVEVEVEVWVLDSAPICDEISLVEWDEDMNMSLDLNLYCSDFDGDNLTFFVNSTSEDYNIVIVGMENGVVDFSVVADWSGEDWIVFSVYDGKSVVNSGNVSLKVLAVNDAPLLLRMIGDFSWEEDGSLVDELDLKEYFLDVDGDSLEFGVEGNYFVDVSVVDGVVSFSSDNDWFGSENVVFFADDGFGRVYSNGVVLGVSDTNEVPEFGAMNCLSDINEDVEYECELNVSDFEGDSLEFEIVDEENVNCELVDGVLHFVSEENYNGEGFCLIRVSDDFGYTEKLIEFNVLPVNDVPGILRYSPTGSLKLMENVDEVFSVEAFDVDGDEVEISWSLGNVSVSNSSSYLFNEGKGVYSVRVLVSDGELSDSFDWNVFVGGLGDFSCGEVGGFLFDADEICTGDLLGVIEGNCCSIAPSERPPEFLQVETCENSVVGSRDSVVGIKIRNPKSGEVFELGDEIGVGVRVTNNLLEDLNFNVEVSFYDISDEDNVDNADDSLKIKAGDYDTSDFVLKIPEKIDANNDYVIYARVIDKNGLYCNEGYTKIKVDRKEDDVVIKKVELDPIRYRSNGASGEDVSCGDSVSVRVDVKNFGSNNQEGLFVVLENAELGIYERSEDFDLEGYDGKDDVRLDFDFVVPDGVSAGEHLLTGTVRSGVGSSVFGVRVFDLVVGECRETRVSSSVEKIELGSVGSMMVGVEEGDLNIGIFVLIGMVFLLGLIVVFYFL